MSLLIDALRKAEQARRGAELPAPPAESKLELQLEAGLPPESAAPASVEPAATAREAADRLPEAAEPAGPDLRAAARNLFEVKQPPPRRIFWPVVGGLTTVAVAALAGYLWWELQPRGLTTSVHTAAPPAPRPPAPPTEAAQPPATTPPAVAAIAEPAPYRPPAPVAPARGSFAPPPSADPEGQPIGPIRRGRAEADAPPALLSQAYAAYNAGELARAGQLYGEMLRRDPHNRDALDGLGAIALRQGRDAEAQAWFQRSLTADPAGPVALAALAELRLRAQPGEGESRMKRLLAAQPEAAPGHFALGNALAAQDRWAEAQQAYFEAHTLDPGNPDYLFNLAVSLDRLRQPDLARRFYGEALAAAERRTASFPREAAEARLQALAEAR